MIDDQRERSARLVYCLSVDLIGSTDAGMALSTRKLDRFNIALVEQIGARINLGHWGYDRKIQ